MALNLNLEACSSRVWGARGGGQQVPGWKYVFRISEGDTWTSRCVSLSSVRLSFHPDQTSASEIVMCP